MFLKYPTTNTEFLVRTENTQFCADCMFLKWVLYDLKYYQEKYFQTHFLNKWQESNSKLSFQQFL